MGYNQDNYRRVRQEYETKYLKAHEAADMRRAEVHAAIPEINEIDRKMQLLGIEIMQAMHKGSEAAEALAEVRKKHEDLQLRRRILLASGGFPPDYTEVKYECPLCSDTGFVDCKMCVCMKKKLTEAAFESSGVANLLRTQTFENFSLDYYKDNQQALQRNKTIYERMKEYAETFKPGVTGNLILFGATGLGKTHLSSAVAGAVIAGGFDVYYTTAVGMLSDFEQKRFGNSSGAANEAETARYYESDLLVIDDLGTEVNNQFTSSVLYDVINTRLNRSKATLISSNLLKDEFRSRYTDRITSRVFGEYIILYFLGSDVRQQKLMHPVNKQQTGVKS